MLNNVIIPAFLTVFQALEFGVPTPPFNIESSLGMLNDIGRTKWRFS